jgi:uncharacterized RDD family membrane protein YckC
LVGALKERVAADLLSSSSSVPREVLLARLRKRLCDNLGLSGEAARWAVVSWGLALKVISNYELRELEWANEQGYPELTPNHLPSIEPASSFKRFLAYLIDYWLIAVILGLTKSDIVGVLIIIGFIINVVVVQGRCGQTLGKKLLKLKLVKNDGSDLGNLGYIITFIRSAIVVAETVGGVFWAFLSFFSENARKGRRTLHDIIVKTKVIKAN